MSSVTVIGRQRRTSDDREGQRPVDVNRHGIARHQVRRAVSARRLHEDHVLQAVAADHHGRAITEAAAAAAAADGYRPPIIVGFDRPKRLCSHSSLTKVLLARVCVRVGRRTNDGRNPKTGRDPGTGDDGLPSLFSGPLFKTKLIAGEIAGGQLVPTGANRHGEHPNNNDRSRALLARPIDVCISAVPTLRRSAGPGRGTEKRN